MLLRACIALFCVLSAIVQAASADDAKQRTVDMLNIKSKGFAVKVWLNDVLIHDEKGLEPFSSGGHVNEWVQTGDNEVRIAYAPAKGATEGRLEVAHKSAKIKGKVVTDEKDTEIVKLSGAPAAGGKTYKFKHEGAAPTELWSKAAKIELNAAEKQAITSQISRLHQAFKSRSVDDIVTLLLYRSQEMNRAMGQAPAAAEAEFREFLTEHLGLKSEWNVKPIAVADLVIEPSANGRLARVTYKTRSMLIDVKAGASSFGLDALYLTKQGKEWMFAR